MLIIQVEVHVKAECVESFIAGGANVVAGDVALSSILGATAEADVDTVSLGFISIGNVQPSAKSEDVAKSFVDGSVTSGSLTLAATGTRNSVATASIVAVALGAGADAEPDARTTGDTHPSTPPVRSKQTPSITHPDGTE